MKTRFGLSTSFALSCALFLAGCGLADPESSKTYGPECGSYQSVKYCVKMTISPTIIRGGDIFDVDVYVFRDADGQPSQGFPVEVSGSFEAELNPDEVQMTDAFGIYRIRVQTDEGVGRQLQINTRVALLGVTITGWVHVLKLEDAG